MPKVSVVLPTYNRANVLLNAIHSAINQTFDDIEILIVDDFSTDNTKEVISGVEDKRITYIQNERAKGPSGSRNSAILKSRGEYIAFLDDDDEWLPEKIQKQISVLERSNLNAFGIHSNYYCIDKKREKVFFENPGTSNLRGNLLKEFGLCNPVKTTTLMVRKKCMDEIGLFDETMVYMEDRDLLIRLSKKWDLEYIREPLVKYYYHYNGQLTDNIHGQIDGKEKVFSRYKDIFTNNNKRWSQILLNLGVQYLQVGNFKMGRKRILQSIFNNPFDKLAYFHILISFSGESHYPKNVKKLKKIFL